MKSREPLFRRFEDPSSLRDYLGTPRLELLDEKDLVYAALIRTVQGGDTDSELALCLLWLGLRPGLEAVYRRRVRRFLGGSEELAGELAHCFVDLVHRMDLKGVRRVAANLVRGTDRDVGRAQARAWRAIRGRHTMFESQRSSSARGASATEEWVALRCWLRRVVGRDDEIVLQALVLGEARRQLALRLGISYEALRKRLLRAKARLYREVVRPPNEKPPARSRQAR